MAAVNLPDNPANGTTQTVGGITYTYNSSKGYWTAASSGGGGGGGGASVSTSDSAPSSPSDGDLWYDTDDGGMFVYYADGSSNQWVEVIGQSGTDGSSITSSDTAPSSPSAGDLWYKSDTNALYFYYTDADSSQWVGVSGPAGATGATGASGGAGIATVVANTTALLAISSPSAGDQAYVTANNTLYFYNGSGWYKIALINATPTISGVNASYTLATDGTATTVTLVASDPEGLPITYSIASDTSGNIATVAQGTGASSNVWTITPSTNTSYAGSFTLTFRASDGVNFATAASSFTLTFIVQNSNYTAALVTSVGANNAVNNTFDDKSTSDHTITVSGDTHHCGMSPYRHGGHSTYFDGAGDYLTVADHADLDMGSSDFTIEGWYYPVDNPGGSADGLIAKRANSSGAGGVLLYFASSDATPSLLVDTGGSWGINQQASGGFTIGSWNHFAIVRNGSSFKLYINGTSVLSATSSATIPDNASAFTIGAISADGSYPISKAYVTDVRVVKGTAVYTSNFTPTTERLTAVTNTKLLTCHLPYFADGSTNGHTITVSGGTHTLPFAPYDAAEYTNSSHLGSVHLDGTGDYLSIPDGTWKTFGTGDWTIEAYIYTYNAAKRQYLFSDINSGGSNNTSSVLLYLDGGVVKCYIQDTTYNLITGSTSITAKTWHHVAVVRNGTTVTLYLDGKSQGTYSIGSGSVNDSSLAAWIGSTAFSTSYDFIGNITDFRVVKGTAVYTSNFTPPTAPLSTITNTSLHLPMADGGIIDKAQTTNTIKLYGNAKSSTTQTKYLTSSIYLDGTGDYIDIAPAFSQFFDFGTLPFTVEFWMYLTNVSGEKIILESRAGHSDAGLLIMLNSGVMKNLTSNAVRTTGGTTIAANTWYHVAVVRDSTSLRTYLNYPVSSLI